MGKLSKLFIVLISGILTSFFICVELYFFAFGVILFFGLFYILNKKIEYGVYMLSLWIPFQYFLTKYYQILPWHFVWVDEFILIIMFIVVLFKKAISKECFNLGKIDKAVLAFTLVGVISAIVNFVNPLRAVLGLRDYLQFYLLYLIVKNIRLNKKHLKIISLITMGVMIIQVPVGLYQFFSWKPVYINRITGGYVNSKGLSYYDAVVGAFGIGANNFGYLLAMFMLFLLGLFLKYNKKIFLIGCIYLFPVFLFARGIGAFFYFFTSLFLYKPKMKHSLKFLCLVTLLIVLFNIFSSYYANFFGLKRKFDNLREYIHQQLDISPGSSGRLIGIKITNDLLWNNFPLFLIGFGPGNYSSYTGARFGGKFYIKAVEMLRSNRALTENDIVPILGEYGYLGLFIFFLISALLFYQNFIFSRKKGLIGDLCYAAKGGFFLLLVGAILTRVWAMSPISFYIWLFAGISESMYRDSENVS